MEKIILELNFVDDRDNVEDDHAQFTHAEKLGIATVIAAEAPDFCEKLQESLDGSWEVSFTQANKGT